MVGLVVVFLPRTGDFGAAFFVNVVLAFGFFLGDGVTAAATLIFLSILLSPSSESLFWTDIAVEVVTMVFVVSVVVVVVVIRRVERRRKGGILWLLLLLLLLFAKGKLGRQPLILLFGISKRPEHEVGTCREQAVANQ